MLDFGKISGDIINNKKMKQKKKDIPQYFDCKICGAIGNWEEFINKGLCHADKPKFKKK